MRFLLCSLLLMLGGCQPLWRADAGPPREYAGAFGGALVWEGVVTMSDDVLILPGGSLTIRPGTEVRVVPAEGTQIDPEYFSSLTELLVRGRLAIEGTAAAPVRFTIVERPGVEEIAWAGITFDGAPGGTVRHAVIERAETGIRCVGSAPEIAGSELRRCRYGIIAQAGSHPRILDNRIEDGEGGVFCWRGSKPYLKGNRIAGHDEEGIFVDADSRPWLDRNTVTGNAIGLALYPRDLPFDANGIEGNAENLRLLGPDKP
ncbi:MAG: right-handed parallel beta-helix repeat-containing protein [Deltaproteobacteria bacterium]|nr:MAG: right-handed parallel beta-helix repeat-containing protein [Deltaproteobacteria bacterium]